MAALLAVGALSSGCALESGTLPVTLDAQAVFTAARQTFESDAATSAGLTSLAILPSATLPATASPSVTPVPALQALCDDSLYVSDITVPDGSVLAAGSRFTKTWLLQNNGSCPWGAGYKLVFFAGDAMSGAGAVLPAAIPVGAQTEISVDLTAPTDAGPHMGQWQMRNSSGQPFGNVLTVEIEVAGAAACKRSSKTMVTISGHAGPENVTIDYGDGTVATDSQGNYAFSVPAGWSGTVTPSKAKVHPWTFEPEHRTYSGVNCDLKKENYKATAPPGV